MSRLLLSFTKTAAAALLCLSSMNIVASAEGWQPLAIEGRYTLQPVTYCRENPFPDDASLAEASLHLSFYELPISNSVPAILEIDRNGDAWFVMGGGGFAGIHHPALSFVGRMTSDGNLTVYRLPTDGALPSGLKIANDRVFITEYMAGKIAVIDPGEAIGREHVVEYHIDADDPRPTALDVDQLGNLWFNENRANRVGRLTPQGTLTARAIPTPQARPTGLVVGTDNTIWFAQMAGNKIGRITPEGLMIENQLLTPSARPTGILEAIDGRIWFSQRAANRIGVFENGQIRDLEIPWHDTGPFFLVEGSDRAIWFTQLYAGAIGRLNPESGSFARIELPVERSWPAGLAFDNEGRLWVTLQLTNHVVVIEAGESSCP